MRWLFRFRTRVPVLIFERVQVGKRLRFFRRYKHRALFVGKLPVLSILMVGLWGYMFYFGGLHSSIVDNELISIFSHAKIDDVTYQVVDFFQKKGQLIIYVIAKGVNQ